MDDTCLNKFEIQREKLWDGWEASRSGREPNVSDFLKNCIFVIVIDLSIVLCYVPCSFLYVYLFQHTHNLLFTTSCFISWPFTEICGKANTESSLILVCFALCIETPVLFILCSITSFFRGSYICFIFKYSLNYNDELFS